MQFNDNQSQFRSFFESLEERVLFDGVPDATFILPQNDATPSPAQMQNLEQADIGGPRELIVVDLGIKNGQQLLNEILESRTDSAFEVRFLDPNENGIEQISSALDQSDRQYEAIHIISHGSAGQVNLGNATLSSDNVSQYASDIAGWAGALTDDADLLFYGCDLAGNAEGEQFIESISAITGADVAASDDLTGAAELGGDWDLELKVGTVETQALRASNYSGVLNSGEITLAGQPATHNDGTTTTTITGITPLAVGDVVTVSNVGTVNGTAIDAKITVLAHSTGAGLDYYPDQGDLANIPYNPSQDTHSEVQLQFVETGTDNAVTLPRLTGEFIDVDSSEGLDLTEVIGFDSATNVVLGSDLTALDYFNGGGPSGYTNYGLRQDAAPDNLGTANDWIDEINVPGSSLANIVTAEFGDTDSVNISLGVTGSFDQTNTDRLRGLGFDGFTFLVDTDGDGVDNADDIDDDNDGILDVNETAGPGLIVPSELGNSYLDNRASFEAALAASGLSTVIDTDGAFAPDPPSPSASD